MAPFTATVVGGGTGGRLSLDALFASDRFNPRAAADLNPEVCAQLAARYPGIRTFTDHQTMFRECPSDIVCVSTFPPSHEPVTMDALQGIPDLRGMLVEKPLGHTVASGRRLLAAIKGRGIPCAVPHGLLVRQTPIEVMERTQSGEIGVLKLVEIQCRDWDIINAGIHWLNFFVTLVNNEPLSNVLALCDRSTRTYRDGMQVETLAVMSAITQSGVRVVMHTGDYLPVNADNGSDFLFRLIGTQGQIEFYGWGASYRVVSPEFPMGEAFTPAEEPTSAHRRHLENMAAQIDRGTPNYIVADSSLLALEIVEGAYLSSRYGCAVSFPVDGFVPPAPGNDWEPGQPYSGANGGRDGRKLPK